MSEITPNGWRSEAHSRLIHAAPDLLAALRKAEAFIADEFEHRTASFLPDPEPDESVYVSEAAEALDTVRAAIAKAEGN